MSRSQVKLPANISECSYRRLQIDKISEGNSSNGKADPFCANMVRKQLAVEDDAGDIDAETVDSKESVERKDANTKTGFVRSRSSVIGYHCGFEDKANATSSYAEEHAVLVISTKLLKGKGALTEAFFPLYP